jgi:ribosome-associated protein
MSQNIQVTITHSPVELYKILKFEGIAASGAEAKQLIDDGLVAVNGHVELRKRKKIVDGDVIDIADQHLIISLA